MSVRFFVGEEDEMKKKPQAQEKGRREGKRRVHQELGSQLSDRHATPISLSINSKTSISSRKKKRKIPLPIFGCKMRHSSLHLVVSPHLFLPFKRSFARTTAVNQVSSARAFLLGNHEIISMRKSSPVAVGRQVAIIGSRPVVLGVRSGLSRAPEFCGLALHDVDGLRDVRDHGLRVHLDYQFLHLQRP